jgi:hypothetical protein
VQNEGERIKFKALHLAERLPPCYVILYYFVILYFLPERAEQESLQRDSKLAEFMKKCTTFAG